MKIVVARSFLFCVALCVLDRSSAQEEDCDCTVYYLCDASNTVANSKCMSPEVCCRANGPTRSPVVTAPTPRTGNGGTSAPIEEEKSGCDCVPAPECPEVSGANQLDIRLGKSCPMNQVCCPRSSSGGDVNPGGGGDVNPGGGGDVNPGGGGDVNPGGGDGGADQFQECGVRRNSNEFANRITAGAEQSDTSFGEYPWMLAVLSTRFDKQGKRQDNVFNCGATLILPHVVMTAAHCVHNIPVNDLKVRGGEWDTVSNNVTAREPLPYQERMVSQVYIHDKFEASTVYNDIALLILDFPLPVKDHIGLVCTPNSADEYDDQKCVVTGWGKDKFGVGGQYQSTLKKLDLKIVPRDTCQQKLRNTRLGGQFKLHESFTCASGGPNQDACKGDGGGPLVCQMKGEPNRYTQVGIVAWGIGCGTDTPGVYVDVRKYKKWILDNSHGQILDTRIRKRT